MRRRSFLSLLLAAALTPPAFAREVIEPGIPKKAPPPRIINMVAYESIGISICNTAALQRVQFAP